MVTPCITNWSQTKDGMNAGLGQCSGSGNHVIDVAFLLETYEE